MKSKTIYDLYQAIDEKKLQTFSILNISESIRKRIEFWALPLVILILFIFGEGLIISGWAIILKIPVDKSNYNFFFEVKKHFGLISVGVFAIYMFLIVNPLIKEGSITINDLQIYKKDIGIVILILTILSKFYFSNIYNVVFSLVTVFMLLKADIEQEIGYIQTTKGQKVFDCLQYYDEADKIDMILGINDLKKKLTNKYQNQEDQKYELEKLCVYYGGEKYKNILLGSDMYRKIIYSKENNQFN